MMPFLLFRKQEWICFNLLNNYANTGVWEVLHTKDYFNVLNILLIGVWGE